MLLEIFNTGEDVSYFTPLMWNIFPSIKKGTKAYRFIVCYAAKSPRNNEIIRSVSSISLEKNSVKFSYV